MNVRINAYAVNIHRVCQKLRLVQRNKSVNKGCRTSASATAYIKNTNHAVMI